jgi:PAS domain S-box-containing protein
MGTPGWGVGWRPRHGRENQQTGLTNRPATNDQLMSDTDFFHELSSFDKKESLFYALSEFSPAGIYLTDKEGDCLYVNRAWQDTAGITADEAMGKGWKAGLHPEDKNAIFDNCYRVVESQGRWNFEYRFINQKTGKTSWLFGMAKPLYNKAGKLRGYLGLNIDITSERLRVAQDKRRLESDLDDARQQLKQLHGILPICASCQKIRDENNVWKEFDQYVQEESDARLSHGLCPDCIGD